MPEKFGEKIKNIEEVRELFVKQKEEKCRERFKEVVGDNIDKIPPGCEFTSGLPSVESITVIKQPNSKIPRAVVFYKDKKGHERHETLSIYPEGVGGIMPKDLKATKKQIFGEVMDNLDSVGLDFWYGEPQDILPKSKWPVTPGGGEQRPEKPPLAEDRRRVEFLRKQPDARFGFFSQDGFKGYYGFLFDKCIVLEHPKCENAAYFVDLPEGLSDEECKMATTHSGRKKLVERYWEPYEGRGKWEMFTEVKEAERVVHKPVDNWIAQMEQQLDQRNPLPPDSRQVQFTESRVAS